MDRVEISEAQTKYLESRVDDLVSQVEELLDKIHDLTAHPKSIDDATIREWSLATSLTWARKDNAALRELCDAYREMLGER